MFSLKCQEFDLNQDPYSLTSLPTGALQIETFVCAPLSAMYMATYNSARFSAAQGVLHRQFGSFTLQASSQSLKNLSLHKSFEEWFDTTRMVVSINMINGTTGPIVLTYTGLEMNSLNVKDWLVGWLFDVINAATAPIMLHRLRDVQHVHRGPVQLGLHPKEDLQSLTNANAIFFDVTMAIKTSASFNPVGGVLH